MALAWITSIANRTQSTYTLVQNDRTWHPVINGRQYRPESRIDIHPGDQLSAQYFVIPWYSAPAPGTQPYGRLGIIGPKGSIEIYVGPLQGDPNNDHLIFRDQNGSIIKEIKLGPLGGAVPGGSGDYSLVFSDGTGQGALTDLDLQLTAYRAPVDGNAVMSVLVAISGVLAALLG